MHLLHVDSSIQGDRSTSRKLSARAADVWRTAHPRGTVTYRDLGSNPVPHLDAAGGLAVRVPAEQRTPAEAATWALIEELISNPGNDSESAHIGAISNGHFTPYPPVAGDPAAFPPILPYIAW